MWIPIDSPEAVALMGKCPHGKTVEEECDECERIYEESGLDGLLDVMDEVAPPISERSAGE